MSPSGAVRSGPVTRRRHSGQRAAPPVGDIEERLLKAELEVTTDAAVELLRECLIGSGH